MLQTRATALSKSVEDAINEQINRESYSAYFYLSLSAYFDSINLRGFAHWMRKQREEEMSHAMRLYDFLNDRNGRVMLKVIEQPPMEFQSAAQAVEAAVEHEREVTIGVNKLYDLAIKESDYSTQAQAQWFVTEQVEEEKTLTELLARLKLVKGDGTGLLIIDNELGSRIAAS